MFFLIVFKIFKIFGKQFKKSINQSLFKLILAIKFDVAVCREFP